ncbi:MAG: hypothetical protein HOO17_12355 [Bacteroidetes Order II. Incertae sedis bacterium]|nr:hypothetical protein [Bacteroidetes Order II. bacterium]
MKPTQQGSLPMSNTDLDSKLARRAERTTKSKNRRSSKKRGLPAIVVFWLVAPFGVAGIGLPVVFGVDWVWLTGFAIILQISMLLINDRKGFIRSREMRRAYEARRHFSILDHYPFSSHYGRHASGRICFADACCSFIQALTDLQKRPR